MDETKITSALVYNYEIDIPLYTTPQPQREFVSLTPDEIWEVYKKHDSMQYMAFSRAIEQALKEKNT